jgi:hypothetical protein
MTYGINARHILQNTYYFPWFSLDNLKKKKDIKGKEMAKATYIRIKP